jgi:hypothetical protein
MDVGTKNGQVFAFGAESKVKGADIDISGLQKMAGKFRTKAVDFDGKELKRLW